MDYHSQKIDSSTMYRLRLEEVMRSDADAVLQLLGLIIDYSCCTLCDQLQVLDLEAKVGERLGQSQSAMPGRSSDLDTNKRSAFIHHRKSKLCGNKE